MSNKGRRTWIYDIEIFPNFFGVLFWDRASDQKREFIVFEEDNEIEALLEFLKAEVNWLVGYNSSKYDDLILNHIFANKYLANGDGDVVTSVLFELSGEIINTRKNKMTLWSNPKTKDLMRANNFRSMDLMSMMYFDKMMIGLKKVAVSMKWPKIQDLPKPFDEYVRCDEIKDIMSYCANDVGITKELLDRQMEEVQIRVDVGKKYGLNLMSQSRSGMADKLMTKFWSEATNQKPWDFNKLRTTYDVIDLSECISDKIKFKTPKLQQLLANIKNTAYVKGDKFEHSVIINNSKYDILLGGLHSNNPSMIIEEGDDYILRDLDVASYYPNLMINEGAYPAHLSKKFLELFKKMVTERLAAKSNGDKLTAEALKIVVNAVYGKLNFEYGWLFDTKACYRVTLTGQLYLMMLVEALEGFGIEVFYANTDGLTCKIHKDLIGKFETICKKWEEYTNLELEYADYKKCIIRDVNNYIIVKKDGGLKLKGAFATKIDMTKGYDKPIIPLAVVKYFTEGIPVAETIRNHPDIYDFCMSQKVGYQYEQEYHDLDETRSNLKITKLQKTNRYYVTTSTGKLYKRKKGFTPKGIPSGATKAKIASINKYNKSGGIQDLVADYNVALFNDYYESDDYKINYGYYTRKAQNIIDKLEPKQISMFN
jgi:hypothetical protein